MEIASVWGIPSAAEGTTLWKRPASRTATATTAHARDIRHSVNGWNLSLRRTRAVGARFLSSTSWATAARLLEYTTAFVPSTLTFRLTVLPHHLCETDSRSVQIGPF